MPRPPGPPRRVADLQLLASRHGLAVAAAGTAPRQVSEVGFDAFDFGSHVVRRQDGVAAQLGLGPAAVRLAVAWVPWPTMPIDWLAISSRRSANHLRLDAADSVSVGNDAFDRRFIIDTDDEATAARLFDAAARRWLLATDDGFGPIEVVFDGPEAPDDDRNDDEPDAAHPSAIYLAREVLDDDELLATLDLAAEALLQFDRRF